jgi:hypothetical protein
MKAKKGEKGERLENKKGFQAGRMETFTNQL